jgi:hypothetical protein
MKARETEIRAPVAKTCAWLMENKDYRAWRERTRLAEHHGLIFIKGNPGSGKSTIMKAALNQVLSEPPQNERLVAAFFFDARGPELMRTPLGFYRSIVYQLIKANPSLRKLFLERKNRSRFGRRMSNELCTEAELRSYLRSIYEDRLAPHTIIFVDALDECVQPLARGIGYFLRELTISANEKGAALDICLSGRPFPSITLRKCPEIFMDHSNGLDIAIYVDNRFSIGGTPVDKDWRKLRDEIVSRSSGVFLWVVLVVEAVLKKWDEGRNIRYLLQHVDDVPEELETLYESMFSSLDAEAEQLTVRLFQWVILAAKPLRLYEWHHILAFIRQPETSSLRMWRESEYFTENDDQLEKQIRSISKGLVEVTSSTEATQDYGSETLSVCARAGSLDLERGETRVVQVIHESVCEYFQKFGFSRLLGPRLVSDPIGNGHLSITHTCLDYLNLIELDALVDARTRYSSSSSRSLSSINKFLVSRHRGPENDGGNFHFDTVEESSELGLNITRWLETSAFVADQVPLDERTSGSATDVSVTGKSQLLEDHFALLMYATFKWFAHARLAQDRGVDCSPILKRFMEGKTWHRWVALSEDLPQGSGLLEYAVQQGLRKSVRKVTMGRTGAKGGSLHLSEYALRKRRNARQSVASFSSAGSHSADRSVNEEDERGSVDDENENKDSSEPSTSSDSTDLEAQRTDQTDQLRLPNLTQTLHIWEDLQAPMTELESYQIQT